MPPFPFSHIPLFTSDESPPFTNPTHTLSLNPLVYVGVILYHPEPVCIRVVRPIAHGLQSINLNSKKKKKKKEMTEIFCKSGALGAFRGFSRVATLFGDRGIRNRD